jgi:hypothetical protein
MIFDNATLLTYTHSPKFFGDYGLNYAIEKNLQIQGLLLDLQNSQGVSGVFSGLNDLINLSKSTSEIIINGHNFGSGYITNISVDSSNWVRTAEYTADIIIRSTGNLYNMTGSYFTGMSNFINDNRLSLITNFSENFNLNLNRNNVYEYSHNLNIEFDNALVGNLASNIAKSIASGIIGKEVPFFLLSGGNNFFSVKKNYSETYDLINKTFSFEESFSKSINGDNDADVFYSYSLVRNEEGVSEVTETADILGLSDPRFDGAKNKLKSISGLSYSRCQSFYQNYTSGALNSFAVSQGYQANRFDGRIQLESKYSDQKFISSRFSWILDATTNFADPYESASQVNLKIKGHGPLNSQEKYENMKYGYEQKINLLHPAAYDAYEALIDKNISCNKIKKPILNLKNKSITVSKYNGDIDYTAIYSDRNINLSGEYTESVSSKSINYPVRLFDEYKISNKLVRQFHQQKSFKEITKTKIRKYNKETILNTFPEDMYEGGEGEITTSATLSINPMERTAQFSVTSIDDE